MTEQIAMASGSSSSSSFASSSSSATPRLPSHPPLHHHPSIPTRARHRLRLCPSLPVHLHPDPPPQFTQFHLPISRSPPPDLGLSPSMSQCRVKFGRIRDISSCPSPRPWSGSCPTGPSAIGGIVARALARTDKGVERRNARWRTDQVVVFDIDRSRFRTEFHKAIRKRVGRSEVKRGVLVGGGTKHTCPAHVSPLRQVCGGGGRSGAWMDENGSRTDLVQLRHEVCTSTVICEQ
ncbi:hypothetical protein V8D89_000315 [Ganoderma adspersum]